MSQPLPRYAQEPDFQAKLARILFEVGEPAPPEAGILARSPAGDEDRLRMIPVQGAKGVPGCIPFTRPDYLNWAR